MENIDIDRIIEMCWEDRTPFEAIEYQFGLNEEDAIKIMRQNLKPKSFKVWRKRVSGRNTKHMALKDSTRFKSTHKRKL
ncbi:TIGR03643 family protein [Prochlorococcus marinus XMU1406]|uniref:TIGR03643 family protein n=1 Tax=Prochlorococcus marinus TaxID=1219 RepID=UPI001ADD3545|nr:TIGR03643 family protein [Prochlorococcus marinus]MBO8205876.1 TIGR03643 family protein [Prochlorococcus marinus XMU1406]MCR8543549.1 TIGR03643 family protein [Prochlorococcus marinus XMU1427]